MILDSCNFIKCSNLLKVGLCILSLAYINAEATNIDSSKTNVDDYSDNNAATANKTNRIINDEFFFYATPKFGISSLKQKLNGYTVNESNVPMIGISIGTGYKYHSTWGSRVELEFFNLFDEKDKNDLNTPIGQIKDTDFTLRVNYLMLNTTLDYYFNSNEDARAYIVVGAGATKGVIETHNSLYNIHFRDTDKSHPFAYQFGLGYITNSYDGVSADIAVKYSNVYHRNRDNNIDSFNLTFGLNYTF